MVITVDYGYCKLSNEVPDISIEKLETYRDLVFKGEIVSVKITNEVESESWVGARYTY